MQHQKTLNRSVKSFLIFATMNFFEDFDLRQINNLELFARQVVEGFIIGLHKSPFHGFSVEFAEHRLYNPGESTKNLDWKVYARTDKLFTKKFEEETNLRCQIIIDASSSMYFPNFKNPQGKKKLNKLQFASLAAASLMNLLKKQRDAFGLSIFNQSLVQHTRCRLSTKHYQLLLGYLDALIRQPGLNISTAASKYLHQIADSIHKRSLVVIFSDMFEQQEDAEHLFSALQHLKHAKHEVILFHTMDKQYEMDFEYENRPYIFVDMENGEKVKLQSGEVKQMYMDQAIQYRDELRMKCLQYGIDYVETDINKGFDQILQTYLVKRSKMN